jgi:hypothetical protein
VAGPTIGAWALLAHVTTWFSVCVTRGAHACVG